MNFKLKSDYRDFQIIQNLIHFVLIKFTHNYENKKKIINYYFFYYTDKISQKI